MGCARRVTEHARGQPQAPGQFGRPRLVGHQVGFEAVRPRSMTPTETAGSVHYCAALDAVTYITGVVYVIVPCRPTARRHASR